MVHERQLAATVTERAIVGAGLVTLDIVINTGRPGSMQLWSGGTCGNVLTILSYFKWSAIPIACLSNDFAGIQVRQDLQRWGVNTTLLGMEPTRATPIFVEPITSGPDGRPAHTFLRRCPACQALLPRYSSIQASTAQLALDILETPAVFFFDRVSSGNLALARTSAKAGALVVFEPSLVGNPTLFQQALELADILVYSRERLPTLNLIHGTQMSRPRLEVETDGIHGLRYRSTFQASNTTGWQHLSALQVAEVRDTAGAGDWFTAGLLHMLGPRGLAGLWNASDTDVRTALMFGQALGAWTCRFEGARGGMYTHDLATLEQDVRCLLAGQHLPRSTSPLASWTTAAVHAGICSVLTAAPVLSQSKVQV